MGSKRKIIEIDEAKCNGCGDCIVSCAEGALKIIDGKAKVVSESFCDGMGACLGACPEGALTITERYTADFDEKAVAKHLLAEKGNGHGAHGDGGCPGSRFRMLDNQTETADGEKVELKSELAQWPIQLRLIPTSGPLYDHRDLLLLADCVPAAYADVQRKLIKGNAIAMSCPKLDDPREAIEKLALIFQNPIPKIKVAIMEVPCCSGLVQIAKEAMKRAGVNIPIEIIRLSIRGKELETRSFPGEQGIINRFF
jgi:NAD-dependent dihydropyrimidine dehydrogenase PreA subunit